VRNLTRAALLAAACAVATAACSSGGSDGPEATGARRQAVERLERYGLPDAEAACIVDELGPEAVNETASVDALVAGQEYRDAQESCADAG
jgi:hypothetical protein